MALFNNHSQDTQSWFLSARSSKIRRGKSISVDWLGRSIALFRRSDGTVSALEARCPHMGANLGLGRVVDDRLVCPFHQWAFSEEGHCVHIPGQESVPSGSSTFSYPTVEKYGYVWIFNGPHPSYSIPTFDSESEQFMLGPIQWQLNCHHHIVVSNGIDMNHWHCVHGFEAEETPVVEKLGNYGIRTRLEMVPSRPRRLFNLLKVKKLSATISIVGGNMAVIQVEKPWRLNVLIAHRPIEGGKDLSKMFVFLPRKGLLQRITGVESIAAVTKVALMGVLLHDDKEILNNIDFWPRLTKQDALLASFVQQVNQMDVFEPQSSRIEHVVAS